MSLSYSRVSGPIKPSTMLQNQSLAAELVQLVAYANIELNNKEQ